MFIPSIQFCHYSLFSTLNQSGWIISPSLTWIMRQLGTNMNHKILVALVFSPFKSTSTVKLYDKRFGMKLRFRLFYKVYFTSSLKTKCRPLIQLYLTKIVFTPGILTHMFSLLWHLKSLAIESGRLSIINNMYVFI